MEAGGYGHSAEAMRGACRDAKRSLLRNECLSIVPLEQVSSAFLLHELRTGNRISTGKVRVVLGNNNARAYEAANRGGAHSAPMREEPRVLLEARARTEREVWLVQVPGEINDVTDALIGS